MATTFVSDDADITNLQAGSLVVRGTAKFFNGISGEMKNGKDINQVTASTSVADTDYVLISNGTSVRRILFSDFVTAVANSINN